MLKPFRLPRAVWSSVSTKTMQWRNTETGAWDEAHDVIQSNLKGINCRGGIRNFIWLIRTFSLRLKCPAKTSRAFPVTFGWVVHRPPCRTLGQAVECILLAVPSDNSRACSPRCPAIRSRGRHGKAWEVGVRQSIASKQIEGHGRALSCRFLFIVECRK